MTNITYFLMGLAILVSLPTVIFLVAIAGAALLAYIAEKSDGR